MKIIIPNFKVPRLNLSKQTKRYTTAAVALLVLIGASEKLIRPNEIGLQQTMGVVTDGVKEAGLYFQVPFAQITHVYRDNTQTIEFGAGSNRFIPRRSSTADRNVVIADIAFQYKVLPDAQKLSFWRWSMRDWFAGRNGYWLLTDMANDSANAVLGQRTMAETMAKPVEFANDLYQDFTLRLERNNVPVRIASMEVKDVRTTFWPTRNIQYRLVRSVTAPSASTGMQ